MKLEDLQAEILRLNKEKEDLTTMLAQKDELLEGFKTKEVQHAESISKYQEQIMKLRDMNTDLFLRVSQPVPVEETEVKEPEVPQEETITLEDILG